jgi:hypothetical protein
METNKKPEYIKTDLTKDTNNTSWTFSEEIKEDRFTIMDRFANSAMQSILNHKHYDGQQMYSLNYINYIYHGSRSDATEKEIEEAKEKVRLEAQGIAERSYIIAKEMLKQRELNNE